MLARVASQRYAAPAGTRSYSYFSYKSGGGRFFNSSRPQKPATATTSSSTSKMIKSTPSASTVAASDATSPVSDAKISSSASPSAGHFASPADSHHQGSTGASTALNSAHLPRHPNPVLPAVHLHSFFSQHRPLLLLDQPVSNLFRPSAHFLQDPSPTASAEESNSGTELEPYAEADADTARDLARAIVAQRLEANVEWNAVLKQLGIEVKEDVIELDSVKRKRRKKITKHKYKKRRKLQRAQRRRLGK